MTKKFDLIIFDCDGTLTDSESINNRALLEVLHEAGFTEFDLDYAYKNWVGTTVSNIVLGIQMLTKRDVPEDVVPRYMKRVAELQLTGGLVPVANAPDLVKACKDRYKICVASNGERRNVIESLKLTGLMENFTEETVFTKIQVKNPKPYPDLFLFAAAQMDAEADRCVVIEDSAAGVRAGAAAGMTTWGFTGSSHDPEKQRQTLLDAGANEVFDSLIHIQNRLTA